MISEQPINIDDKVSELTQKHQGMIERFLEECVANGASHTTHERVVYPPPDQWEGRILDAIHAVIPKTAVINGVYPTLLDVMSNYPYRRIFIACGEQRRKP